MGNAAIVVSALRSLLRREEDELPFVIFEHTSSKKFVQFAGSIAKPLLLDLPWQTLSESEFYRAVRYFKGLGVVGEEQEVFAPDGKPVDKQFSFQMSFQS